jgi:uracil-DNA glycosylase
MVITRNNTDIDKTLFILLINLVKITNYFYFLPSHNPNLPNFNNNEKLMPVQKLPDDWNELLKLEFEKPYYSKLISLVSEAYQSTNVFPPAANLFNALCLCHFNELKVVIIGQDPYHNAGQAHGLCFSVNHGVKIPPSLRNIFKELSSDIEGFTIPDSGNLEAWARQGVLLLNSVLTVKEASPGSHKRLGWENFTDAIIKAINDNKEHIVFLLWGNYAITKKHLINAQKHLVLTSAHPSPLAGGAFSGNRHFSKTNDYLKQHGKQPIDWRL